MNSNFNHEPKKCILDSSCKNSFQYYDRERAEAISESSKVTAEIDKKDKQKSSQHPLKMIGLLSEDERRNKVQKYLGN